MKDQTASNASPWPHRWAVLLCCATFPLIWVGGLVTTYDAGMAVPDWPSTYGYNLFLYPPSTWFFGPWDLFIEHGHRLLGALVGLLTIAFTASVWRTDKRGWMRILSIAALALVILQGSLGGARVLLDDRLIAMVHGCVGPAYFALCVALAVCSSPYWHDTSWCQSHPAAGKLQRLAILTAGLTYAQLVIGAQLRHIPAMATHGSFRLVVLFHLSVAALLLLHIMLLALAAARGPRLALIRRPTSLLVALIVAQIGLGSSTWVMKYGLPAWASEQTPLAGFTIQSHGFWQSMIVTGHVAMGSLITATAVTVVLWTFRLLRSETVAIGSGELLAGVAS
jgi:cytochrome c oxidase assembly protein subunit 15